MQAFLGLVADGKVRPSELVSHRFPFSEAERAFEALEGEEPVVGIVLAYSGEDGGAPAPSPTPKPTRASRRPRTAVRGKPRLGVIGAGSFATATAIPGLLRAGFEAVAV